MTVFADYADKERSVLCFLIFDGCFFNEFYAILLLGTAFP